MTMFTSKKVLNVIVLNNNGIMTPLEATSLRAASTGLQKSRSIQAKLIFTSHKIT